MTIGEEVINTTQTHPFYVEGKGYVEAAELKVGDVLRGLDGSEVKVEKVEIEYLNEPVKVYNFTVEDWHNYFVSDSSVLVHNAKCNKKNKKSKDSGNSEQGANINKDWVRMTAPQSKEAAAKLGFTEKRGEAKNKEPIYYHPKLKKYISQDIGSGNGQGPHNGGVWKMAGSLDGINHKNTRYGTYNADLSVRLGD